MIREILHHGFFIYNYLTDRCEVFRLEYRAKNIHRQITKYGRPTTSTRLKKEMQRIKSNRQKIHYKNNK